jgi:predicted amidohydrolase
MRVAVVQFAPVLCDVLANLRVIVAAVAEANRSGADLVVAPEMSLTGWTLPDPAKRARLARQVQEEALPELHHQALSRRVAIVVGGLVRADAAPEAHHGRQLANAAIMFGPDGVRTEYHKIHLFGDERAWWAAGRAPAVGQAGGLRVGLTICYDAEFPEVPRMTRLAGADLLAVPTTNMTPYERDQDVIFAARAIENECPVIVANRVGHESGWTYFGRSLVIDQRGQVVAQAGSGDDLLLAEIQPASPGDAALSYLSQRRPEVYGPLVGPVARPATS